jgi:hypothetical protein
MEYLLIALAVLALAHFVAVATLAPSIRRPIKHQFLVFRDAIRNLKYENGNDLDDQAHHLTHHRAFGSESKPVAKTRGKAPSKAIGRAGIRWHRDG